MHIQCLHDFYYLLTAVSSVVILTLSFLLVSIRLPQDERCQKFSKARYYLSLSYLILGVSGLLSCILSEEAHKPIEQLLVTAIVASFQSLLFTSTHIVFIQPEAVKRKKLFIHIFAILLCAVVCFSLYFTHRLADPLLVVVIVLPYLLQQIYYTFKFSKLHHRCVSQMEQFYDEEQESRLRWVKYSFYGALSIGLLSLISSLTGLWVYIVFIVLYTTFYTYMVVLLYNNKLITKVILPAVVQQPVKKDRQPLSVPALDEPIDLTSTPSDMDSVEYQQAFKQHLESWIAEKGYLQKDLSVDDIAHVLGVHRDYLRYYFRTYVHSDFRTWRSKLRINEAKCIMKEHPEHSFSKIAEMVGFNHRSNFFSQFLKIEGMTPTEWMEGKE